MKKLVFISLVGFVVTVVKAAYPVPTMSLTKSNVYLVIGGDSYFADPSGTEPEVAPKFPDYYFCYWISQHPTNLFHCWNLARSGEINDGILTNQVNKFVAALGARSNVDQHMAFIKVTENGNSVSNQTFITMSNIIKAPALMSDGSSTTLSSVAGWSQVNTYQWYGLSDFTSSGATGNPILTTHGIQSSGWTNSAWLYGQGALDILFTTYQYATNDTILYGGGHYWITNGAKAGHPSTAHNVDAFMHVAQQTCIALGDDTNIASCVVDYATTNFVTTNHCVGISVTRTGNSITFVRKDDRTTFVPGDFPNASLNLTNDGSYAYTADPAIANMFFYGFKMTNLPAGATWQLTQGGLTVGTFTTAQLQTDFNEFTNQNTPQWAQAVEGLGMVRDWEFVNRTNLIPGSAGSQQGMVSWGSNLQAGWVAGNRGDSLIAYMDAKNVQILTNAVAVQAQFQPTNQSFTLTALSIPGSYSPAPFR